MPKRVVRVGFTHKSVGRTNLATMHILPPTKRVLVSEFAAASKRVRGDVIYRMKGKGWRQKAKEKALKNTLRFGGG